MTKLPVHLVSHIRDASDQRLRQLMKKAVSKDIRQVIWGEMCRRGIRG